jgi:hypothetical protein
MQALTLDPRAAPADLPPTGTRPPSKQPPLSGAVQALSLGPRTAPAKQPAAPSENPKTKAEDLAPSFRAQPPSDDEITSRILEGQLTFEGALQRKLAFVNSRRGFNYVRWSLGLEPEMVSLLTMHWAALFKMFYSQVAPLCAASQCVAAFDRVVALPYRQVSKMCMLLLAEYVRTNQGVPPFFIGPAFPFRSTSMATTEESCAVQLQKATARAEDLELALGRVMPQVDAVQTELEKNRKIVADAEKAKTDMEAIMKRYTDYFGTSPRTSVDTIVFALVGLKNVAVALGVGDGTIDDILKAAKKCKTQQATLDKLQLERDFWKSAKSAPAAAGKGEIESLRNLNRTLTEQLDARNAEIAALTRQLRDCTTQLSTAPQPTVDVAALTTEIADLREQLIAAQTQLAAAAQSAATGEVGALRAEIADLRSRAENAVHRYEDSEVQLVRLRGDNRDQVEQIAQLQAQLLAASAPVLPPPPLGDLSEQLRLANARVAELEGDVQQKEDEKRAADFATHIAEEETEQVRGELLTKTAQLHTCEERVATLNGSLEVKERELIQLRADIERKSEELHSATDMITRAEQQRDALRTDLASAQQRLAETGLIVARNLELTTQLEQARDHIQELESRPMVTDVEQRISSLRVDLTQKTQELNQTKSTVQNQAAEISELKRQVNIETVRGNQLASSLDSANAQIEQIGARLVACEQQNRELTAGAERMRSDIEADAATFIRIKQKLADFVGPQSYADVFVMLDDVNAEFARLKTAASALDRCNTENARKEQELAGIRTLLSAMMGSDADPIDSLRILQGNIVEIRNKLKDVIGGTGNENLMQLRNKVLTSDITAEITRGLYELLRDWRVPDISHLKSVASFIQKIKSTYAFVMAENVSKEAAIRELTEKLAKCERDLEDCKTELGFYHRTESTKAVKRKSGAEIIPSADTSAMSSTTFAPSITSASSQPTVLPLFPGFSEAQVEPSASGFGFNPPEITPSQSASTTSSSSTQPFQTTGFLEGQSLDFTYKPPARKPTSAWSKRFSRFFGPATTSTSATTATSTSAESTSETSLSKPKQSKISTSITVSTLPTGTSSSRAARDDVSCYFSPVRTTVKP